MTLLLIIFVMFLCIITINLTQDDISITILDPMFTSIFQITYSLHRTDHVFLGFESGNSTFMFPRTLIPAELRNTCDYTTNTILLTKYFLILYYIFNTQNNLKW
jgi:hypothetical protein